MKYSPSYIAGILLRYVTDELTPEEIAILDEWLAESEANRKIMKELQDPEKFMRDWKKFTQIDSEACWRELQQNAPELFRDKVPARRAPGGMALVFKRVGALLYRPFSSPFRIVLTSMVLILIVSGLFLLIQGSQNRAPVSDTKTQTTVYASRDQNSTGPSATLQLPGAPVLKLNDRTLGNLGQIGSIKIDKTGSTEIRLIKNVGEAAVADSPGTRVASNRLFSELSTPPGVRYRIVLPDGTAVQLNAGSTLRIPTDYGALVRDVVLNGEAYFEVMKDAKTTNFKVHTNDTLDITCTGTRFDVKAYGEDRQTIAWLEEGAIKMEKGQKKILLTPGQSGVLDVRGNLTKYPGIAVGPSWKDGRFDYKNVPASDILLDIGHWYGVRIKYTHKVPNESQDFFGSLSDPIDSTIAHLARIVPFEYKRNANNIIDVSY